MMTETIHHDRNIWQEGFGMTPQAPEWPQNVLSKMFSPSGIAVIGATARETAYGNLIIRRLLAYKCPVPIYPVNPKADEISGLKCYPSLSAIPGKVDLVYLATPAANGPSLIEEAGLIGVQAAVLIGSGFADAGPEGAELQRQVVEAAARHGIAICGPNNLGFANYQDRIIAWTSPIRDIREDAGIAVISQSGCAAIAMTHDPRRLGLNYMVTAGNEANVSAADYLGYFASLDTVKTIIAFLETIRDPAGFAHAAASANEAGKRIALVKVGRSEGAQRAVAAHSGGIAGDDAVYDTFFRQTGVLRADDYDELFEAALLLSRYPDPPRRKNVAVLTLSGGEAALATDLFAEMGVSLPDLSPATIKTISAFFPSFMQMRNPVDGSGMLPLKAEAYLGVVKALLEDDAVDAVVLCVHAFPTGMERTLDMVVDLSAEIARTASKPIIYINNASANAFDEAAEDKMRAAGLPALLGMRPGIAAVSKWLQLDTSAKLVQTPPADAAIWQTRARAAFHEDERLSLLSQAGVPMAATVVVASEQEAVAAQSRLGGKVVLKGTDPVLLHKTERGLVKLGLTSADAVALAYREVAAALAETGASNGRIIVQSMVGDGVELILGVRQTEGFGTAIIVGLGGTLVEVLQQASVRIAPISREMAREMLEETPAARLLRGVRGKGPYDTDATVDAICAFSQFAQSLGSTVKALEINPLFVLPEGEGVSGVDIVFEWQD
jgi:acyl-CoA synthetase (NDP forming)